jgi:Adenylyl/Guanylyl and SMODS C-terminal sensor domain/Second Messenger Oligonucleotide or Dinucleotide Synthetase domain
MGIASSLFFSSNDTEKQTLHRRITPSDEQTEEQQERWNELAEHLVSDIKTETGCTVRTWLQGSYKFGTQIRPPSKSDEFDIDLGIFVCWPGHPQNGPHRPERLRAALQKSLQAYSSSNDAVRSLEKLMKPRCGRIHYDGDFHIDIPIYHLDLEAGRRTLATDDGWETSDPKALYVWFKDKFDETTRAKCRRQIRYLKSWAALKWRIDEGRPSSVLLTVLAAEAFAALHEDQIGTDDNTLLNLLRQISNRIAPGRRVSNPANSYEDLNRLTDAQWSAFCKGLYDFIGIATSACAADNEIEAADLWSQAFAHFFPMPDISTGIVNDSIPKSMSLVPIAVPDVNVRAVGHKNTYVRFDGRNGIGPIPKDCGLTFEIADPSKLRPGTSIDWMVRNEGTEAEMVNDLGHRAGSGLSTSRDSAYIGTHYMDCILRQNGRIYGVRRVPVRVSGVSTPPRNPAKRPPWTSLRARR